jgi:hypothetical protein
MQAALRTIEQFAPEFFEENFAVKSINLLLPQPTLNGAQGADYAHE